MVHGHRGGREERGERKAGGGRERSELRGHRSRPVGPTASSRIQVATNREGTGVDLDLEEDDASEREWRLGQRGEGGRRREGKERGHRSRAGAGIELKVKDPGGDGDGSRDETGSGMRCGEGEVTGKGGTGNPSRSQLTLIYSGRWASGLGSWAARLPVPPVPVPCHGPGRRPKHGTGPRAVPALARWPACRAGPWAVLRAVPAVHGPNGNL
jgi:hypothetical protein